MNSVAIVLASGSGQRFGNKDLPKHLTPVLEVPIFIWTVSTVIQSKLFSSIVVVTSQNDYQRTEKILKEYFSDDMSGIRLTEGGNERRESFLLGLEDLTKANLVSNENIVALFDANRPFAPMSQLQGLYEAASEYGCSCPARPLVNGVARMDSKRILDVPDKSNYFEFVTPEFMRLSALKTALENSEEGFYSLVEYSLDVGLTPMTVDASNLNTKLTYPEDKTFLEGVALDNKLVKPSKFSK